MRWQKVRNSLLPGGTPHLSYPFSLFNKEEEEEILRGVKVRLDFQSACSHGRDDFIRAQFIGIMGALVFAELNKNNILLIYFLSIDKKNCHERK